VQVVYPHNKTFATPADQAHYIREWLVYKAGLPSEAKQLNLVFYPARVRFGEGGSASLHP
jgi:hypothetical protein